MSDAVSFVAVGVIADAHAFREYAAAATALMVAAGGEPTIRLPLSQSLLGVDAPAVVVAITFKSAGAVQEVLDGPEYAALLPQRAQAFSRLDFWLGPTE